MTLTQRHLDVLDTVKEHRAETLRRLNARNMAHAVAIGLQRRLI